MRNAAPRVVAIAAALSMLAGFVDAVGYINLGGVFVSFMSGNSTRFATGLGGFAIGGSPSGVAGLSAGIIVLFVIGVMIGAFAAQRSPQRGRVAVLICVALALACAAACASLDLSGLALAAMVLAMGAENAAVQQDDEAVMGVTYMTGALVKIGQRLVAALSGEPLLAVAPQLLLWAGLVAGGVVGALAARALGLEALWIAACAAAALAVVARIWAPSAHV